MVSTEPSYYFYCAFVAGKNSNVYGNLICVQQRPEFNIGFWTKRLMDREKCVVVLISWQQISYENAQAFAMFCDSLSQDGGAEVVPLYPVNTITPDPDPSGDPGA